MTHRPRGDHGYNVGMTATAVGLATGAVLARAHEDGVAAVRRHFEARQAAVEEARQALMERNGAKLEALAHRLADEVLLLREEADKLRRLLAQRQAVIDGLRKR